MNTADNCTDQTENKDYSGKVPALPSWRMKEIVDTAFNVMIKEGFMSPDFDYKKMILDDEIRLKPYSQFSTGHLAKMQKLSLSYWNEGLCVIFPDETNGGQCKLIAYNDSKTEEQIMMIIFHEYAHITLKHTEQCIHGELEATCFASAMVLILLFGKIFSGKANLDIFLQGIKKEAV